MGVSGPPVVCGPGWILEPLRWVGGGWPWRPHWRYATSWSWSLGQLASFGLPWWRRAGRQTRCGVTPKRPP